MVSTIAQRPEYAQKDIFAELQSRYPRTVAAFSHMENGAQALASVAALEQRWIELNSGSGRAEVFRAVPTAKNLPPCPPEHSYDVIIAGGSLGLVAGVALAKRGLRVLVFDRDRVGSAHREWNISARELDALAEWNVFSSEELAQTIANRYSRGVISFDAEGTGVEACPLILDGMLDVALDAQAVLDLARRRFLAAGGTILEGRLFKRLHRAERGSVVSVFELEGPGGTEYYRARLAVDTMGATSPIAMALNNGLPFDGVCPTAGTIVEGLGGDTATGDVLVSIAPVQGGRQLIWEGFPGREGETTVYLFYYDKTSKEKAKQQSLLSLFEQYFTLLPTYKQVGEGQGHIKPVYGYIPARHGRTGRIAARGLICLGDSAAGQSPLTFCGFGSFVRHVGRISALVSYALRYNLLEEQHLRSIGPHQPNLKVAWVFSRLMQPWSARDKTGVNRLMNVFCRALSTVGATTTLRFLQDRYTFGEYLHIMLTTARQYPAVFMLTARVLGASGLIRWAADIATFAAADLARKSYLAMGSRRQHTLEKLAARISPPVRLRLMAARTLWKATR